MIKSDQSWYQKVGDSQESEGAGGVVVRIENGQIFVALLQEGGLPGYVLPKGHIDPGEDEETAARREVEEEAGIQDLKLIAKLGSKQRMDFEKKEWKTIHYFLYLTQQTDPKPSDPKHLPEYTTWFPIDELPEFFWPEQKDLIVSNYDKITALLKHV